MLNRLQATSIKLKRIQKGWSVIQLAKKTGVSREAIYNYEKGVNFPSPEMLKKLAKVFDCDIKELID
mgnify:CR=1 FL=1